MSSKKAEYESSMLCPFGAIFDVCASSELQVVVGINGLEMLVGARGWDFSFVFGAAVSLLTRTDAGIMAVSSGVCCANGRFTTVDAADFT